MLCSPQVLWSTQDPQAGYPTKAYCIQLWISYLWCGQRTCSNLKSPSRQVPPSYKQHSGLCGTGQTHHSSARGMPQLLWCVSPFHISPNRSSLKNNKGSIGKGPHPQGQDSHRHKWHYPPIWILSETHLFLLPRPVLWKGWGCGHGFPGKPHSSKPLHGVLRAKSPKLCTPPPRFWCRFVHNTFVIHKEVNKQDFLQHINSVDPAI